MRAVERVVGRLRIRWRKRRMALFARTLLHADARRILDIGGTPDIWRGVDPRHAVTLLNLPGVLPRPASSGIASGTVLEADVCRMTGLPAGYDIVFSNSVLEHVGSARRQRQFADIVRQCARYWVQVPAPLFPIEVHCRIPFWWALPKPVRIRMIRRWRRIGNARLARQMAGTRPISAKLLRTLFPDAQIMTERFCGLAKSYYVVKS